MRHCEQGDELEMSVEPAEERSAKQNKPDGASDSADFGHLTTGVLRSLLEQIPVGAMIVSAPTGQLLAANSEIERILGEPLPAVASASAFVDRRLQLIDGEPDRQIIHDTLTGGPALTDASVQLMQSDGSAVELVVSSDPVREPDGRVVAAVVTCREIPSGGESDQSTAIWVRADLLTTISSITRDRMRDSFLSTAAHELRTPLTTIAGFSQLLERQVQKPDLDRERLMALTRELRRQVARMSNLTDDLMKAVALRETQDSGQQQVCDILSIAQASVDRARLGIEFSERHQIVVEADEEVAAFCDPEHLDQILGNLLSNALKFSPDGGIVTVGIARFGDHILISVRDEGIGISPEDQRRLWQPFSRFGSLRQSVDGTGLGLYIVHHLVEQNGGTISVESAAGSGSTFTVTLPAWPAVPVGHSPE